MEIFAEFWLHTLQLGTKVQNIPRTTQPNLTEPNLTKHEWGRNWDFQQKGYLFLCPLIVPEYNVYYSSIHRTTYTVPTHMHQE